MLWPRPELFAAQISRRSRGFGLVSAFLIWGSGCADQDFGSGQRIDSGTGATSPLGPRGDDTSSKKEDSTASAVAASYAVLVRVTLDGQAPGSPIKLKQGGVDRTYKTNADGLALMGVELVGVGDVVIHASHPDARVRAKKIDPTDPDPEISIDLVRFDRSDNPDYEFTYPGTPDDLLGCSHCHNNIHKQWWGTAHQTAGKNPFVHDVYAGVVSAYKDEASCTSAGGRWLEGLIPGTGKPGFRCYKGVGALPDINPHCGDEVACDSVATEFGGCGDCHIPGMNGQIGGRNLLEAVGDPYDFGIHCDVCHKVESVDLAKTPGIAGALKILRPTEPPFFPIMKYRPLHFGPFMDVSNFEMGPVQRDHFGQSRFCAGCHDYDTDLKPKWGKVDVQRWPTGRLPVQSTYQEWLESPMNPTAPCGSCHMPPNPDAWNGADSELMHGGFEQSPRAGWLRPAGAVRDHTWVGPRTKGSSMLELSADLEVTGCLNQAGDLDVDVHVKNIGPGHALPTGLPSRAMILLVKAYCGDQELEPIGGTVVPDFGGFVTRKEAGEDWKRWPKAKEGDVIRVLRSTGTWRDYQGPGPFGDGTFGPKEKGLEVTEYVGSSKVLQVFDDGTALVDNPLPKGSVALLTEPAKLDKHAPLMLAGAPGYAFARVYADKEGKLNVPSFRAVDIVIDNRIPAQQSVTTQHRFDTAGCQEPRIHAALLYRSFPPDWVRHWQWERDDVLMTEVYETVQTARKKLR